MQPKLNKILAILVAMALAFVPVGSALARVHACGPVGGDVAASSGHAGHAQHQTTLQADLEQASLTDECADCAADCCTGPTCSAGVCSGGIATLSSALSPSSVASAGSDWRDVLQSTLSEGPSSPFRPPQI